MPALVAGLFAHSAFAIGDITAESAIVIEAHSGKVLYEKDADSLRYPASTTKMMTALLFIENVKPDEIVTAPADVDKVTGSSLHLMPGEQISADDLVYALLLRSANDAAYTAAVRVSGSVEAFAKLMTERAKAMGCTGTKFTNPHGLHDPGHYTTARDLALIAQEAMKNPRFAKAARTHYRLINRSMNTEDVFLSTHNKFLKDRADATGVKTGWTVPAGRCFVGSAERDGLSLITVVLKSTDWKGDSDILADWAFDAWTSEPLIAPGQVLASVPVKGGDRLTVPLASFGGLRVARPRGEEATFAVVRTDVKAKLPIHAGAVLGTVTVRDQDGLDHTLDVFATTDVSEAKFSISGDPTAPVSILIALVLAGGAWVMRRRAARI